MFFWESGPMHTPFIPNAIMPLTVPLYMSFQMCVQE